MPKDPFERLEQEFAIDEARLAADSEEILKQADARMAAAEIAAMTATSDTERMAAYLEERDAAIDAIRALSADARVESELSDLLGEPD